MNQTDLRTRVELWREDLVDRSKRHISLSRRRRIAMARLRVRLLTADLRVLPDFLIIGAQRSGTSSLYKYLGFHPLVVPSLRKETDYFSFEYAKGARWYRAHFPLKARAQWLRLYRGEGLRTFEATPDYLFDPYAPERVHTLLPYVKLIALLRNPVDRAYSHYLHNRRLGHETLDFAEAIARETERLAGEAETLAQDPIYRARKLRRYSYCARGVYAEQMVAWHRWFPPEQIMVIKSEDFFTQPRQVFLDIQRFLELPKWEAPEFRNHSYLARVSTVDEMTPELRRTMIERFREDNQRLYQLLSRDFGWE